MAESSDWSEWQRSVCNAAAPSARRTQGTATGNRNKPLKYRRFIIYVKENPRPFGQGFVFALPIFPSSHPLSIVGVCELNFCVRDGNRWTLTAINTNYLSASAFAATFFGDPYRIRTDVNGVRGRCLNHLTNGPWCTFRDSNPGPTD